MAEIIIVCVIVACAIAAAAAAVFLLLRYAVNKKKNDSAPPPAPQTKQAPVPEEARPYGDLSDEVQLTRVLNVGRQMDDAGMPIRLKNLKTSRSYSLTVCPELIIGRLEVDGVFTISGDSAVSKRHCRIYIENGELLLEDLNSSNHTFLNDKQVNAPVPLKNGDTIRVGDSSLMIFF